MKSLWGFLLGAIILLGQSAYSQKPGTLLWEFDTKYRKGEFTGAPAIGADGTIYFGSGDTKIYAVNSNGTKKWEFDTGESVWGNTSIGPDGTIYCDGYALSPEGIKKWKFTGDNEIAIGSDGVLYTDYSSGFNEWSFYALNTDGTEKWKHFTGTSWRGNHPAIGSDGTIYSVFINNQVFAFNPDGTKKWQFKNVNFSESSPSSFSYTSLAIDRDGTIYFGSDYKVYALNPNGTKKWEFRTGDEVDSSPAIGSDGTIFIGSDDEKIYAIRPNGTKKWEFETRGYIWSSPAIGNDGTLYIGSNDGKLYALKTSSKGPADSPWPMFGGSALRRGSRDTSMGPINPVSIKITKQPESQNVEAGSTVQFSITANSDLDYLWYYKGKPIEGANESKLTIENASLKDEGEYKVKVSNDYSEVWSEPAKLEIKKIQPTILLQPKSQNVEAGSAVQFSVTADAALEYQWYKNGQVIAGANSNILKLDNVTKADETIYSVRIKNEFGKVISDIAQLTVIADPPVILTQPNDTEIDLGQIAEFTVKVSGTKPFDYQWYKNGVAIENGHKATLVITDVSQDDLTIYSVRIKNQFGKVVSRIAELKIKKTKITLSPPTISSSGKLVLIANGPPNRKVIFQYSNDLKNWKNQITLPLSDGATKFNVPVQNTIGAPNVFYRLKLAE